jgi:hypothetical protein
MVYPPWRKGLIQAIAVVVLEALPRFFFKPLGVIALVIFLA